MPSFFKFFLFSFFFIFLISASPVSAALLSCQNNCTFCDLISTGNNIIKFATELAFILVVGMIVYGGFTIMTAGGNSGAFEKGKKSIYTSLKGLVIILVGWVFVTELLSILVGNGLTVPWYEIPCDTAAQEFDSDWSVFTSSGGSFSYPTTETPYTPPASDSDYCKTNESMANYYGVPSTPQNDPQLSSMIDCIKSELRDNGKYNLLDTGQIYTYENDNKKCNFTRGLSVCGIGSCAHKGYSCHYGGVNGKSGALGVDFNAVSGQEQALYNALKVIYTSNSCSGMSSPIYESTHTHISHSSCNSRY